MACCAFAVVLLLNLLGPLGLLRHSRRRGLQSDNAAVAWRYGEAGTEPARIRSAPRWRRAATGVVAVEVAVLIALAAYLLVPPGPGSARAADLEDWDALAALQTVWCREGSARAGTQFSLLEQ